jgi:hypothetical protein
MRMQACNHYSEEILQSESVLRICLLEFCKNEIPSSENFEIKILTHTNALHWLKCGIYFTQPLLSNDREDAHTDTQTEEKNL